MSHNHDHSHHHHGDVKNIKTAFFLNFFFTLIEIVGGFYTNSIAILSDALHDLGDSLSLGLAWYFQKLSKKRRDRQFSYGYKRFSLLAAIINSLVLIVGSVFILMEAIPRLMNPVQPNVEGMMLLAMLGVLFNGAAVLRLNRGESMNEQVAMLHLLEDVFGWVAVLIGSVIMYYFDLPIVDPILSLGISMFILFNVYRNLRQSLKIVLQAIPKDVDQESIRDFLNGLDEVAEAHDMHIWSMDGQYNVLTTHLVLEKNLQMSELQSLKKKIREGLHELGIEHTTMEFELKDEDCVYEDC
jgi:cobalt-zinc-cadmium efflux system protein